MGGPLSAMPTDILLLCVVIFVTSVSTFCCQIFGRMCAKKLLAVKGTEIGGPRHTSNPARRRRDQSSSTRSLSSLASLDYASSTTSEDGLSHRLWRIRKRRHLRPPHHSVRQQRSRPHRSEPQSKNTRRHRKHMKIRHRDKRDKRLTTGPSGTFGRLGIPKEQILPQELKLVMNRLEDKNLSPMLDTVAGYFLPKGSRQGPRHAARRPPLRPLGMIYSRNRAAPNSLGSESDLSTTKSEEAYQGGADPTPDPLNNIEQDHRKGNGFLHGRSLYDGQSPRDFVLNMPPLCR